MSVGVMKVAKIKLRDLHVSDTLCCAEPGGLEHLKIKTRLIDEKFVSVMGECVFEHRVAVVELTTVMFRKLSS